MSKFIAAFHIISGTPVQKKNDGTFLINLHFTCFFSVLFQLSTNEHRRSPFSQSPHS